MTEFIATHTDVTDWIFLVYQNTTGSRSKKIIVDPISQHEFFFKGSKELPNGEIKFPTEFWSEIISSKIGQYLGFNVLDYNIGYNETGVQKIGCLSKSMVSNSINKLTEGKVYLTGYDSSYDPEKDKKKYTFQFIRETLVNFRYEDYIPNLLEIIVFDAVIGNSDRHQENWGVITNFEQTIKEIDKELKNPKNKRLRRWSLRFSKLLTNAQAEKAKSNRRQNRKSDLLLESDVMKNNFSPIYDSGCCLGRELLDVKINKMLNDKQMLEAHIRKGTSEIHWHGIDNKLNHFELIKVLQKEYPTEIGRLIKKVKDKYSAANIKAIIDNIDNNLPQDLINHKLAENRKDLMVKLITLRVEKLLELE
jgi:hypothetical protein